MSNFAREIQETENINLNTIVQTLADITSDYLLSNQVLSRLTGDDLGINMITSTVYHIADEIVFPALVNALDSIIYKFPLIGNWLSKMLSKIRRAEYIKVLLRIIVIVLIQRSVEGKIDIVDGVVMFLSTYAINFTSEIGAVKNVLDYEIGIDW